MPYQEENIKTRVVGVDISSNLTTLAVVNIRGNIIAESNFDTSEYPDVNDYVKRLSEEIVQLVEANGGYDTIRSVGISAPSASFTTGCLVHSPNLPWKGIIPLAAMLRDQLGLAVALGNDAHVAALGEHAFGSAHGMSDFILVTLGGGVGSCFFSAGHEHQGYEGLAGEIGHTCIEDHGRQCGCGNRGCLEAYTNAKGIVLTAQEMLAASDEPSLMRNLDTLTPLTIKECCDQGDKMAIEVYRKTGYLLGIGLANYADVINPQAIILTGGISKAGKWLTEPLSESFEEHILMHMRGKIKILTSKLNNHERDVLGASVLAWQVKEYSLFV